MIEQAKLRTAVMSAMQGSAGKKELVSCFQAAGKLEYIEHYQLPKLIFEPRRKLDYRVHLISVCP